MTSNPARDTFSSRRGAKYEHKCDREKCSNCHESFTKEMGLKSGSLSFGDPKVCCSENGVGLGIPTGITGPSERRFPNSC
jgi:hypothetical protein